MILDRILNYKRSEVQSRMAATPLAELQARANNAPPVRDFAAGLVRNNAGIPAVIAEVKKASPSKGVIRQDFDPVAIARAYEAGGAAAISCLTDEEFFQGSLAYLTAVKQAVSLPVLRKDFIIDEYQIVEARAAGADAILLIVAALDRTQLSDLMRSAQAMGMQCLVETHDEQEMQTALDICASLIGINNRNLYTFEVSLDTTARLAPMAAGRRLVSESGVFTRDDMVSVAAMGADAVLVGEALMRSNDIEAKLKELTA
jgi:indole-3-glycerol phosphate synthase